MESFTIILTSSAFVNHVLLYYFPQQDFAKWLCMTCNCIWGTEIAFETKKQKYNIVYAQKYLSYSFHEFTGSYPKDEPNFPRQNNLILQKKVVWHRQGCEFQGLFKT